MLAPDAFSEFPQVLKGIYDPLPETYSEGLRDLVVSMLNKDVSKRPTTNDLLQVLAYRASASVCSIAVKPIRPCRSKATRSSHSLPLLAAPCGSHQGTRLSQRPIFRRPGLEHLAHETPAFSFSPGRGFSPGEGRGGEYPPTDISARDLCGIQGKQCRFDRRYVTSHCIASLKHPGHSPFEYICELNISNLYPRLLRSSIGPR